MAKEVAGLIKLQIRGGAANPAPPASPELRKVATPDLRERFWLCPGDREVVMAAVKQNGRALARASLELRGFRAVVLEAVKQDGTALKYVSDELRGDREVVLKAVKQSGLALGFASANLRGDQEGHHCAHARPDVPGRHRGGAPHGYCGHRGNWWHASIPSRRILGSV